MSPRGPKSLLWRLGLVLMLAQFILTLAVGGYAYWRIQAIYFEQTLEELQRITPLLIDAYGGLAGAGDEAALDARLKAVGSETSFRMSVILPDGRVIADSSAVPATMDNHRFRPEIDTALGGGVGTAIRYSTTMDRRMMYFARAVPGEGDDTTMVVRAALPMQTVHADFVGVARLIAVIGLVFIVLTCLVTYFVSRRFTTQVAKLASGARQFASGELAYRIRGPASAELSILARGLNEMARQLSQRIEELKVQKNEQQAILQSMSNGVIALDGEQRILMINRMAAQLFGVDEETVAGRLVQEVIREPDLHKFIEEAFRSTAAHEREFSLAGRDDAVIRAVSETLEDSAGRLRGIVVIMEDRTEQHRYEAMRSDFASSVSHELRTPITNIRGYVETLMEVGTQDPEQTRRFLSIIKTNSSRLGAIIEDVLSLSRLERADGPESLERRPTPLAGIIRELRGQFADAAREKNMTIETDVPDGLSPPVHSQLIEQAIGNLLSNAINYGMPNTTVRVAAQPKNDGEIEIAVIDEGPGIAAIHLPRLFERFYRVDKARSRDVGGTGLGLALVKHIAQAHGGRIDVTSEVGQGSRFSITIPAQ